MSSLRVLSVLFLIFISLPILNTFLHFLPENLNLEKKGKKTVKLDIDHPAKSLAALQDQFNQNFSGRTYLFKAFCNYKINFFGSSPLPEHVLLGKNKWLYYSIGKAEDDWRGISTLDKNRLEKIKNNLGRTSEWFKKRNIRYYHILVPDKDKIYPEYLPANVRKVGDNFQVRQVEEFLKEHNNLIYLRDTLLARKNSGKLYFESDHHWNKLGAFIGYSYIIKQIQRDFPRITPKRITDYKLKIADKKGGDLAYMMGLQESFLEKNPVLVPTFKSSVQHLESKVEVPSYFTNLPQLFAIRTGNKDKSLPKVLVFRDSFASALIPYLQENFRESLFIWDWHLDKKIIEQEKPDIVIRLTVERNIDALSDGL